MKNFLIIPIFLLSTMAVSQEMKVQTTPNAAVKDFYPKQKSFKLNNYATTGIIAGGCVSGNCKNGTGTWIQVSCPNIWKYLNSELSANIYVRRYQGQFSADGNEFEGNYAEQVIQYSIARKGSGQKGELVFEPVGNVLLADENVWTPHHLLKGKMYRSTDVNYGYDPAGWKPVTEFKDAPAGMPRTMEIYCEAYPSYARITYAPGGVVTSFTGKISRTGDPLCGRFQYSDGSKYEGFVYHGRYLGIGKFTDAKGKVKEGVWRLDSLVEVMPVNFPPAAFEPQEKSTEVGINYFPKQHPAAFPCNKPRVFAAEKGWAFAYDSMNVVFGQVKDEVFTGKGMWINFYASKTDAQAFVSYHVGEFTNCELQQGLRITDDLDSCEPRAGVKDPFPPCRLMGYSIADAPHFDFDQIDGCGRKVYYSADGKPKELVEGYFAYAPVKGDDITGWAYVNDWGGLRQKQNLQFRYKGLNALIPKNMTDGYYYVIYQLQKNQYCFPSIEIQSESIRKRLYQLYDSINRETEKNMKERETVERIEKQRVQACMEILSKRDIKIGTTLTHNEFVGVLQDVDCQKETMTLVVPGGASTLNRNNTRTVPLSEAWIWRISDKQFYVCPKCDGLGGEHRTTVTSKTKELPFGYFSGIETKVTHTKTETSWQNCLRCGGRGVILD